MHARDIPAQVSAQAKTQAQPRTRGAIHLSAKARDGQSVIRDLRMSGSYKALFPRGTNGMLQAIAINTSGGLTSGDRLTLTAEVDPGAALGLTTQAAERAYRSVDGAHGHVDTKIEVSTGATLHWLPQELILYDGCALSRTLDISLAHDARLLMVEPVIFGRAAMGEVLRCGAFVDRIRVSRNARPLYHDATHLTGDINATLARPAVAAGAGAMASLLYVAPDASARLDPVRSHLPATGGASCLADDVLCLRLLAPDSHLLRRALLPILDLLSGDTLPVSWRL